MMFFSDHHAEKQFDMLIRERLSLFRGLARRILANAADVDDAVQAALCKAWLRRRSFRDDAALASWVARIVINQSYDILRKQQREQRKLSAFANDSSSDSRDSDEALQCLDRAIAKLPELYRQTVHIAILSDLDTASAAKLLGCSANTLYQRIHKAKELLRKSLSHE
ncbi:MAG: RNA polymerase sigma factor [Lentisphaerae bacterium]|jgi:RNA polymerase sigma-70 factor (ECF subfamily)|nr:RNA polymerase sigma factor [Lentisphaerota bacterium]